jgi:hypothetical protein
MNFFRVNLYPRENPRFGFIDMPPEGTEAFTYCMAEGIAASDRYPPDAHILLEKGSGVKLPDLLGNTDSFLVVSKRAKEVIERMKVGPVEYLPLAVHDPTDRPLSRDYFIVNPLGSLDCLDLEASEIEWFEGDVVGIDRYVLDPAKVADAPDLFRIQEEPHEYVMSERLVGALQEIGATNIYLYELEQSAGS